MSSVDGCAEPLELAFDGGDVVVLLRDRDGGGAVALRLLQQQREAAVSAQRDGAVVPAEVLDHLQRVAADRAGRTEDGDAFPQGRPLYRRRRARQIRGMPLLPARIEKFTPRRRRRQMLQSGR